MTESAPRSTRRTAALHLLGWCGLVLVLCPTLLNFSAIDLPDEFLEFHVAGLSFLADGLAEGQLAWWNPYKHGGASIFADPTCLGPFYPLVLLLPFVPLDLFILLAWVLHLGAGALGVQHWARELGAGRAGATAAGLSMLLSSGPVIALADGQLDVVAILAWLPWVMLALRRAFDRLGPGGGLRQAAPPVVGAACALGLIGLGSHARFAAIAFAAAGVYGVALWAAAASSGRPAPGRWLVGLATPLLLGGLLAAPAVLPAVLEVSATRTAAPDSGVAAVGQVLPWRGLAGLIYPRALVLDERWYHLGAAALLPLLTAAADRRGRAVIGAGALLLLLGMGAHGPLFFLVRPVHWLLYPVETGVAAMALPFLGIAIGLAVDRLTQGEGSEGLPGPRLAAAVTLGIGGLAVVLGNRAELAIYAAEVETARTLARASAVHGGLAVVALAGVLLLGRKLGPRRLATALLVLLVADGLAYGWRVQTAVPSPSIRPSEFVAPPDALAGLDAGKGPRGRVLQWPQRPIRDFTGCLEETTDPGHGWGINPMADPAVVLVAEAAQVLAGPLRRNVGAKAGIPHVGGRAKVPPMPWSVVSSWLATDGPTDLGVRHLFPRVQGRPPSPPPCHATGPSDPGPAGEQTWLPPLLEVLHVRWIVSAYPIEDFPGAAGIGAAEGVSRFEVIDPRPDALLSPEVVGVSSAEGAERLLFSPRADLRTRAVVDAAADVSQLPPAGGRAVIGTVRARRSGVWDVELPGTGGLLTVAERYHPGWTARAGDGRELGTLAANLVQLGVVVPAGVDRVSLRFRPPGLGAGLLTGLAGLTLLLGLLRLGRREGSRGSEP